MKFSELAPRERHNFVYFLLFFFFYYFIMSAYLMRWSLPPSRYYAEDRLSFGELSWKTLRSLVSIWVKTLSIFIARIVAGRLFTVKNLPGQS
ncbi:hypothetical protein ACW63_20360 [Klebsiella quasipneumoniae subsp. quasipneumoniae]|nr:hypothetical protein ACW63_20360 [Klebsiella quasipneumoniae subsp. quasipneumoniae]